MTKTSSPLTLDEIRRWKEFPLVNPRTNRAIAAGGKVYKAIEKEAADTADVIESGPQNANDSKKSALSDAKPSKHTPKKTQTKLVTKQTKETDKNIEGAEAERGEKPIEECRGVSSKKLLGEFVGLLRQEESRSMDASTIKAVEFHVNRAIRSYDVPFPIQKFRTLEDADIPSSVKYEHIKRSPTMRKLTVTNCHDGQRKLTMALLEFVAVSLNRLECDAKDVILVYAGASGLASAVASSMFPGLRMILYDPAPNTLSHMPVAFEDKAVFRDTFRVHPSLYAGKKLAIFTGRAGWFGDDVAVYCKDTILPHSKAKHLLFTSDVRKDLGELDIANDMRDQMRWTMLIGCSSYMHKFRLPYLDDPTSPSILRVYRDLSDLPPNLFTYDRTDNNGGENNRNNRQPPSHLSTTRIPYLDGNLHIQLYGRQRTAELRLIGFAASNDIGPSTLSTNRYALRDFEIESMEDKMATFNAIYRGHARFSYGDDYIAPREQYLPASFEVVSEHHVISQCAQATRLREDSQKLDMHNIVREMLATFTPKDPLVCSLISAATEMKKHRHDVRSYAPHVLDWTRQVLQIRPNAAIPKDLLQHV
jgi:hypothetical protein